MTGGSPAAFILRLAVRIMPQKRRSWAAAMAAEFQHLPQGHMAFALGCLRSAIMTRLFPLRDTGRLALLALIGLAFLASAAGTVISAMAFEWSPQGAAWLLAWIVPMPVLIALAWQRVASLTPVAAACLLAGTIGTGLVVGFPHTDLARATGSAPLVLAVCAALALAAGRLDGARL